MRTYYDEKIDKIHKLAQKLAAHKLRMRGFPGLSEHAFGPGAERTIENILKRNAELATNNPLRAVFDLSTIVRHRIVSSALTVAKN